jgi:hypothetical protein
VPSDQVVNNTVDRPRLSAADRGKLRLLSRKVQRVVFVLREHQTYDTYFGDDRVLNGRGANGEPALAQYGFYVPACASRRANPRGGVCEVYVPEPLRPGPSRDGDDPHCRATRPAMPMA